MSLDNTTPVPDKSPDRITPSKGLEPDAPTIRQPVSDFQSMMQGAPGKTPGAAAPTPAQTGALSPLHGVNAPNYATTGPTVNSLIQQSKIAQDSLGIVHDQLNTKNLKLKRSQAHLLKNKLGDANTYTRAAAAKLGIESPPLKSSAGGGPIERFLSFVNDGQDKMVQIQQKLSEISSKGDELRPGDMLLVQIKMGQAQQEIDYSSTLLSKVIDSMKQLMNIQL